VLIEKKLKIFERGFAIDKIEIKLITPPVKSDCDWQAGRGFRRGFGKSSEIIQDLDCKRVS